MSEEKSIWAFLVMWAIKLYALGFILAVILGLILGISQGLSELQPPP